VRRERLDIRLTNLGLTESRAQAKVLIEQGLVTVDGELADKPSRLVTAEMVLEVVRPPRYVSRGALKLEVAVREFGIDFTDCTVLDVGASTGGFTDYAPCSMGRHTWSAWMWVGGNCTPDSSPIPGSPIWRG